MHGPRRLNLNVALSPLVCQGDYEGAADILEGLMTLLEGEARLESEDSKSALTSLGYMCMMLVSTLRVASHVESRCPQER